MKRTKRPSRSRAHDFSALSTSIGVALTLALWGAMVVGAMVVQELRRDWMSSMRVEVVLEDVPENEAAVQAWLDAMRDEGVAGSKPCVMGAWLEAMSDGGVAGSMP